jgi:hypothetical protein
MSVRVFVFLCTAFLICSYSVQAQANKNKSNKENNASLPQWEKLGEKIVSRVKEYDELPLSGNGLYSALKVRVIKADVIFDKMVVVYQNGQRQEFQLRRTIRENEESRVIDLPGNKREIRVIQFRYETKGAFEGRARVQVWGRK